MEEKVQKVPVPLGETQTWSPQQGQHSHWEQSPGVGAGRREHTVGLGEFFFFAKVSVLQPQLTSPQHKEWCVSARPDTGLCPCSQPCTLGELPT